MENRRPKPLMAIKVDLPKPVSKRNPDLPNPISKIDLGTGSKIKMNESMEAKINLPKPVSKSETDLPKPVSKSNPDLPKPVSKSVIGTRSKLEIKETTEAKLDLPKPVSKTNPDLPKAISKSDLGVGSELKMTNDLYQKVVNDVIMTLNPEIKIEDTTETKSDFPKPVSKSDTDLLPKPVSKSDIGVGSELKISNSDMKISTDLTKSLSKSVIGIESEITIKETTETKSDLPKPTSKSESNLPKPVSNQSDIISVVESEIKISGEVVETITDLPKPVSKSRKRCYDDIDSPNTSYGSGSKKCGTLSQFQLVHDEEIKKKEIHSDSEKDLQIEILKGRIKNLNELITICTVHHVDSN